MTTKLTKAVTRETTATFFERGQRRNVLVTLLNGSTIELRLKGTRRKYQIDAGALYPALVKQDLAARERERKAAKKGGRRRV